MIEKRRFCGGCDSYKEAKSDFYITGGKCKDCQRKYARENRAAKILQYQEYDRQRRSTAEGKLERSRQERSRREAGKVTTSLMRRLRKSMEVSSLSGCSG